METKKEKDYILPSFSIGTPQKAPIVSGISSDRGGSNITIFL